MGGCNFGKTLLIDVPKRYRGKTLLFSKEKRSMLSNVTIWNPVSTLPLQSLWKPETHSFKRNTIKAQVVSQPECLEKRKRLRIVLQMRDLVLHILEKIGTYFWNCSRQ